MTKWMCGLKLAEWDGEIILSPPLDREGSGNREPAWSEGVAAGEGAADVRRVSGDAALLRRNLGKAIADARWQGEPPAKSNLYLDGQLYIEEVQEHWPDAAKAQGKWHLLTERNESINDDLATLERDLYAWAMA